MSEENTKHSITLSAKMFWALILILCILLGALLGILIFESRQVILITEEMSDSRAECTAVKEQYDALLLENEGLKEQVQVLSDTINKHTAEADAAALEESESRIPTAFPVTGSVREGEPPEEDSALTMAVYYEADAAAVVVATAKGEVISVRQNAYNYYEIQIDHGNGYVSVYTNLGYPLLTEGTKVLKGTPLFMIDEENTLLKYQISKDGGLINVYDVMHVEG
jgi:septal ring factor EnvC (AmiA/AmiB activator)